jgi:Domain of unknown function (DUF4351)
MTKISNPPGASKSIDIFASHLSSRTVSRSSENSGKTLTQTRLKSAIYYCCLLFIVDLVTRVMSYMFIDQSPQEIDQMLDIQFEDTRVYKDTYAKVTLHLVLSLLEENCGQLKIELVREVNDLPIDQLEALAKALLKFKKVKDLEKWLQNNASETSGA